MLLSLLAKLAAAMVWAAASQAAAVAWMPGARSGFSWVGLAVK